MEENFSKVLILGGSIQNYGKIWGIESSNTIVLLGVGKDIVGNYREGPVSSINIRDSGRENKIIEKLKEKKNKIKAIFLNNSLTENSGNLLKIYNSLELEEIPIYCSDKTNKIIRYLLKSENKKGKLLIEKNLKVIKENGEVVVEDFKVGFSTIDSYIVGNLAFAVHHKDTDSSFYYLDDFKLTTINNNPIINKSLFPTKLKNFLNSKMENNCLIVGVKSLHFNSNGSFKLLESNAITNREKLTFLLLYEFDWTHIIEIVEMADEEGRIVKFTDEDFYKLIKVFFSGSEMLKTISFHKKNDEINKDFIYILTMKTNNLPKQIENSILEKCKEIEKNLIINLFTASGNENLLAETLDFLYYQKNSKILNLSKREEMKMGIGFFDLKTIIDNLNPKKVFVIQNSYKHKESLKLLRKEIEYLEEEEKRNLEKKEERELKNEKELNIDNILVSQRNNLLNYGVEVIVIFTEWREKLLELKKISILAVAIFDAIEEEKIRTKIEEIWKEIKDKTFDLEEKSYSIKKGMKQLIERKISFGLRDYSENPLIIIKDERKENEQIID